jgi:hypothetical protein
MSISALALATSILSLQAAQQPRPIEVMVLGTWHFDNPGQDLYNVKSEDVLTQRRQREIGELVQALGAFKPTKIAVERVARTPDLFDQEYAKFSPSQLATERDERFQIAYRLASQLRLPQVYAIDEQPSEGEPDYFPFGKLVEYVKAKGLGSKLEAMTAYAAKATADFEAEQPKRTIAQLLVGRNDPKGFEASIGGYYRVLEIGDTEQQPGADLNAMWYLRNAKIFAKLITVAKPGDRILVVFGAGHGYWLRHFASETPGFKNVDPIPFLKKAGPPRR